MNTKIFLCFAFLVLFGLSGRSQQMPIKNIPSPEVAGLGEFGKIPVSLYTGVPDITIPLYDVKTGSYSLSLAASYHLASVKPNSQSGCLGVGWNLIAGGYITRSVRGMYDEKCESNGYAPGYYTHASKLKNISNEQFAEETKHIQDVDRNYYELTADEFSFSFCGYSGNFYYTGDGEWQVISDQDIRVEFTPTYGEGFVSLSEVGQRISINGWGASSSNNRFFNKFTLVTPDGCRYEFGGVNATEYCIPYYARYNSDLIATTWRLSKITTVDSRTIEFSYDTSAIMCDLRYVPQNTYATNIACGSYRGVQSGRSGMTGYLLFPVNIKSIKTADETLEFNYYSEYGYSDHFVDEYLAWLPNEMYYRQDIDNLNNVNPAYQFSLFLGSGIDMTSVADLRKSIKSKLKHYILHNIYLKGKNQKPFKTIYFDYDRTIRTRLALITERLGNPDLMPNYVYHPLGYKIFTGYKLPPKLSDTDIPEYRFSYNTEEFPSDYIRGESDAWGYYTGKIVKFADIPDFTPRQPILKYTMAEVLQEITYPTGGKSRFEYQLHTYSKVVNPSLTSLTDKRGTAGGLRIQRITNLDMENNVLSAKRYYYSKTRGQYAESSGVLKSLPVNEITYTVKNSNTSLILESKGGFFASVTNMNTPDVGYSCVIEETVDKNGISQGYITRRYSNYDSDIYGNTHFDRPPFYSMLDGVSYTIPYSSRAMERGKLMSEEYYDANDQLRKKIEYRYKEVNPGSFVTAYQTVLFFCTFPDLVLGKVGTLMHTYTNAYLVDSVTETLYTQPEHSPFTNKKTFEYNKYKQLSNITTQASDGKVVSEESIYAAALPEYKWMEEKHILSPVYSKKKQTGNSFQKEIYQYGGPIPYIKQIITDRNGHTQKHYTVEATDDYGNPLYIHEKGIPVVLIWGGQGQRLIARIENATMRDIEKASGLDLKRLSSLDISNIDYSEIENARHEIPGSLFHIYKYTPKFYLKSETKPNGETVYYKYDFLGRLILTSILKEKDGSYKMSVLNKYDYQYYSKSAKDL